MTSHKTGCIMSTRGTTAVTVRNSQPSSDEGVGNYPEDTAANAPINLHAKQISQNWNHSIRYHSGRHWEHFTFVPSSILAKHGKAL